MKSKEKINISVIYLPHISNFTDFDALRNEPDVFLKYVKEPQDLDKPDAIVIPGTKNTIEDLQYLKRSGLAGKIASVFNSQPSTILIGICGGYQMLGEKIFDPKSIESKKKTINALGILPIVSKFYPEKILSQVKAKDLSSGSEVIGYEIHHGKTESTKNLIPKFEIHEYLNQKIKKFDGAQSEDKRCWGTYIHGIFDNDIFRRNFLNSLRKTKGDAPLTQGRPYDVDREIDKLAKLIRENINLELLYKILWKGQR